MSDCPEPLLAPEHAAFIEGGVSISIGGCSADNLPSLCRAIGCRVSADRRRVTVFVAGSHARPLLEDIRATGAIAVVISRPSNHRTLQLKGRDARVVLPAPDDLDLVERYRAAFVAELEPLGYAPPLIRTFLACAPEDVVALTFSPCEAFDQTPGPHAGQPLKAA